MEYVEVIDDRAVIRLKDRISYKNGAIILGEIKPFMGQNIRHIDIYCGELKHISSAGIRALIHIKREMQADVTLHNVKKAIKDVITINLADGYFIFEDEKQEAE